VLTALTTCFRSAFAILCEVPWVVRGTTATVAILAALAASFRRTLTVVRKVAGAMLAANLSCARSLLAILCEIARVPRMSLFGHRMYLLFDLCEDEHCPSFAATG
jgi:hypothetical protein